jgi:hypothetical protein
MINIMTSLFATDVSSKTTSNIAFTSPLQTGFLMSNQTTYTMCNVGIGLSNPSSQLHVSGTIFMNNMYMSSNGSEAQPNFTWTSESNTGFYGPIMNNDVGITLQGMRRAYFQSNAFVALGSSHVSSNTVDIWDGNDTRFVIDNPSNRIKTGMNNGGAVYIGTPSNPTGILEASWQGGTAPVLSVGVRGGRNAASYHYGYSVIQFETNKTTRLWIPYKNVGVNTTSPAYTLHLNSSSAAKPSTSVWSISSDARLKTNIQQADLSNCSDVLRSLPLKKFAWKDEYISHEMSMDRSILGWIATDVEQVLPRCVDTIPEMFEFPNFKTLNPDQLYAAMYGSIQALQDRIKGLQSRISRIQNTT